jgi:CRP-like cAMP-binding protein
MRDMLKLRIPAFAADVMTVPYYYFQHKPVWASIFLVVAFMIVNGVRIVTLTLERRPVVLSDREEELYRVAFGSIEKREFLKLASLVRWVDLSLGELIIEKGQQISNAIVVISGEIEAVLSGKTILAYCPGQLIGNVSAYSGLVSPMDVMARGPARLAMWEMEHIREFTDDRPELRARLLQIVNADLTVKLQTSISNLSHN